ncbi:MAG: ABC transporter permease subunit [Desulfofustis sp.]|jgi:ABC-type nitrate/sulfonate/bicarbonate transport system permease component|nr:ABC transporter permease subunit [Desulfofustis sp.]
MRSLFTHSLTLRVLSFAIVFGIWEYLGRVPISPAFPTFLETMSALGSMIADGSMAAVYPATFQPLLIGLVISSILGIACGVFMGLNHKAEWFGAPVFIVLQSAPLAALIPLLTFAYGIGLTSKIITVCIMSVPVIVLNAYTAVRHTPVSMIEMGESYLGSRRQIIMKIIIPSASPVIYAGLRLGAAMGFIGAILAELLITPTGIGDLITYNQSIAEYEKMYAAIFSIMVFAVIFIEILERTEYLFFRPDKRVTQ